MPLLVTLSSLSIQVWHLSLPHQALYLGIRRTSAISREHSCQPCTTKTQLLTGSCKVARSGAGAHVHLLIGF
ncbi:hypothetical protein CC86DRAFT_190138 [Ophiobolus disseminans]|uniref:Uncharacterized protein n=1 Tax=Ophiobolus disseminans TaxID=1469910 RepID=A0A6A7A8E9_9PLEO|nr:hypothetical protein CC86DRAFT_190138 [Ophiobolus disseminans]